MYQFIPVTAGRWENCTAELSEIMENVSLWKFPETLQAGSILILNSKRKLFQSLLRKTASRTRYWWWLVSDFRNKNAKMVSKSLKLFLYFKKILEGYHLLKWTYLSKAYKEVKTPSLQLTFLTERIQNLVYLKKSNK